MNPRCSYTPEIDALGHEQREIVLANIQESSLPPNSSYFNACLYIYSTIVFLHFLMIYNISFQSFKQTCERKFVTQSAAWRTLLASKSTAG